GATRLTDGTFADFPLWSPDGNRIVFTSDYNRLRERAASGEGDGKDFLRAPSVEYLRPTDWSRDGKFLLYSSYSDTRSMDMFVLPKDGAKPVAFKQTAYDEDEGRFSPDGRWVAYVSDDSGQKEVYVAAAGFDGGAGGARGRFPVSRG